jgi:hypothetical protein
MKRKRTVITIEMMRVLEISTAQRVVAHCAECAARVEWVTVDEAALLAGVSSRMIFRRVEAEQLHFTEISSGLLFICLNSLGPIQLPEPSAEDTNDQ